MSDSRDLEDTAALCLSWCLGKTECRATVTIFIDRETACFLFVKEFDSSQEDIGTMAMLDIPQETLESKSSFSPEEYLGVHTSQQTQSAKTPRSKGLDVKTPGSSGLFTSPGLMKISTIVRSDKAKEVVTTPGTVKKSSIVSAREFKQFGLMESPFDDPQSPKGGFLYKFDERHALKDIAALCLSWCLRSTSCQATVTFRHFRYNACFLFEQEFETYYHEDERTLVPLGITPETLEEKSSKFKEVPSTPFAIMSLDLCIYLPTDTEREDP
ncbi:hypothetical protein NEOLI_004141 [Neolecta irregularis DAH-3]|uniref:Uncharacterized protein n=1 Tax=Neolecta irregularis (strain DAH-3) TaxID=1198029 RepID=A0A1U7LJI8_NEOID|nr:hypothetical protein NEOLI_004141 [Neolecta irregularis DAH-3]|eukprot:OLL22798.1 hypothetical protein NEOLI_004141 [Neolecta irregularis DAH-3]